MLGANPLSTNTGPLMKFLPGWRNGEGDRSFSRGKNGEIEKFFPGWRKKFLDVKHLQVSPTHEGQVSGHENPLEGNCQDDIWCPTRSQPASTHRNWLSLDQLDGRIEHDGTFSNSTSQPVLYL